MAIYGRYFVFNLSLILLCVVFTSSLEGLEPTKACSEKCKGEGFPNDTPNTEEFRSCSRGCRFYILVTFLKSLKNEDQPQPALDRCLANCEEAYPGTESTYSSCAKGCNYQQLEEDSKTVDVNEDIQSQQEEAKASFLLPSIHTATPVMQVRKVMSDVVGQFQILTTQVLTYFIKDDQTLLAVQSEPQVMIKRLPEGFEGPETEESFLERERELQSNDLLTREDAFFTGSSPSETVTRVSLNNSRRYTYLMHLLLLLTGVSLSLLGISYCLALARQQQRKTLKAANLNLALQQEPLKLVRPEDLTKLSLMEEDPLPSKKQDLNLSHANV